MKKFQHKLFLIIISSALCAFVLHYKWSKQNVFLGNPQYSALEAQESRKSNIRTVCVKNNLNHSSIPLTYKVLDQLYVEHSHKFIYCEVPKVGCSNWKRIILLLNDSTGLTPDKLRHYNVHTSKELKRLSSYPPSRQKELLAKYTKVMFTRDPMERVVSAYRDKFLHEDDVYYSKTIANMIRKSLGIQSKRRFSFEEFATFITTENPYNRDIHWRPMYELCDPCNIQYDFIGKFETVTQDSDFVLKAIRAPENLKYPTKKHHNDDPRTNYNITLQYLDMLSPILFKKLMSVYSLDFSMFDYSYYYATISKLPKTT
ncbi:carbohydrate sulfotransferase 9-like [Anomaloglossus baeobatrachus]|uniref:carbohydrate sulfotransferase 9-like n=1 Tax=Anomaloglossus baeobatrachus TaxID=238106 RepID=UPI003F50821D